jgi:hypothetical protein
MKKEEQFYGSTKQNPGLGVLESIFKEVMVVGKCQGQLSLVVCAIQRPRALVPAGNFLEVQNLRLQPGPTKSKPAFQQEPQKAPLHINMRGH